MGLNKYEGIYKHMCMVIYKTNECYFKLIQQLFYYFEKAVMDLPGGLKKQNDGQLNLYRVMRLQNRENNFTYRDQQLKMQFKVNYQHFPLQTIHYNDLLKMFWKFITTHHFKKIGQEEKYILQYLQQLFNTHVQINNLSEILTLPKPILSNFQYFITQIFSNQYLQQIQNFSPTDIENVIYIKKLFIIWAQDLPKRAKKTKKIVKAHETTMKKQSNKKKYLNLLKLREEQKRIDQSIQELDFMNIGQVDASQQKDNIEDQIARLQKQLQQNQQQNRQRVLSLQQRIRQEQQEMREQQEREINGEDASCIEWLVHILQQKQIAQSVIKVVNCERSGGQSKFLVHLEAAMNISPLTLSETQLKRINLLREISLFKFYKTGVKSIYSFACHNSAGLADMYQNRMNLSRHKEKDYMGIMKKGFHLNAQLRQEIQEFDVCHHCKYIYPNYLLTTCKFVSERQSMPKSSQAETDLYADSSLQRNRTSQRFVSKHRNCFNGYARVNDEYVCGRKFCKSCLKDSYGSEWMKNNNGLCPFCLAICSCTRCLRHEKINKLKSFFVSLGGNLQKLQQQSSLQKLPIKRQQIIYKPKPKPRLKIKKQGKSGLTIGKQLKKKTKMINKQNSRRITNQSCYAKQKRMPRFRYTDYEREMMQEETERWSSTAQKELQSLMGKRASKRRILGRLY